MAEPKRFARPRVLLIATVALASVAAIVGSSIAFAGGQRSVSLEVVADTPAGQLHLDVAES